MGYTQIRFSLARKMVADAAHIGKGIPFIHAVTELEVTEIQQVIRNYRRKTSSPLSLNTFLLYCFGKTLGENSQMHALKGFTGSLYQFDTVDVFFPLEIEIDGELVLISKIIRSVNHKSLSDIEKEIQLAKKRKTIPLDRNQQLFLKLPFLIRKIFYKLWMNLPLTRKSYFGNAYFSCGGMTGRGTGWGFPLPMQPIGLFTGSIADKPVVKNGNVVLGRIIHLTFTADHVIVDGGMLARFMARYMKMVESEMKNLEIAANRGAENG